MTSTPRQPQPDLISIAPFRGPFHRKRRNRLMRANERGAFRLAQAKASGEWGRLLAAVPGLADTDASLLTGRLQRLYAAYTAQVSEAMMAASLSACVTALRLVQATGAKRIADLGSGFSSVAFRAVLANPAFQLWSVDDDAFWLARTGSFLGKRGLRRDGLMVWQDFAAQGPETLDLIFHDLGDMVTRRSVLPLLWQKLAPGGVLVLDDMHKPVYRRAVRAFLADKPCDSFSLQQKTGDQWGRYDWAVIKLTN